MADGGQTNYGQPNTRNNNCSHDFPKAPGPGRLSRRWPPATAGLAPFQAQGASYGSAAPSKLPSRSWSLPPENASVSPLRWLYEALIAICVETTSVTEEEQPRQELERPQLAAAERLLQAPRESRFVLCTRTPGRRHARKNSQHHHK